MSNMLASDLGNTEFSGAVNPDSRLAVQFYSKPIQNDFETEKQQRPIFEDRDFIKIFVPGDPTTVIDTFVREEHKKRFPLHWAHYQNAHGGDAKEIGTPLAQWPRIGASQAEELKALKFYTVEAVANASDAQLQRIGMIAGSSPYAFRDDAIRFLKNARGDSIAKEAEDKAKHLEEENKKQREEFERQMGEMRAQIQALVSAPKKRGRPAKEKAE